MPQRRRMRMARGGAPGRSPLSRWVGFGSFSLAMVVVVLVGLALVSLLGRSGDSGGSGNGQFPASAYNSAVTLAGYKVAARIPKEVLSVIPCYCGCGPAAYGGHISLEDCFFLPSGSFNDHASNCHLCAEEAVDVGQWYDDGLDLKVIRAQIVQKYSEHGPGTDTPPIS